MRYANRQSEHMVFMVTDQYNNYQQIIETCNNCTLKFTFYTLPSCTFKFPTNLQKSTVLRFSFRFLFVLSNLTMPDRSTTTAFRRVTVPSFEFRAGAIAIASQIRGRNVELHRLHKLWPSRFRNAPDFLDSLSAAHRLITERMPAVERCKLLGSLEQTIGIGWINGFAAGGWTGARERERETTRA